MDAFTQERMSDLEKQLQILKKRTTTQQTLLLSLATLLVLVVCVGANYPQPTVGHFKQVFANSLVIRDANGRNAVSLYATKDGAGSILIRDSSGQEAIQLISGSERNDLLINDRRNGRIAVAIQGTKDRGRLSLFRTFPDMDVAKDAAKQTFEKAIHSYTVDKKGK